MSRQMISDEHGQSVDHLAPTSAPLPTSQSIEWYAEGQSRTVDVNGVRVTIRLIGRSGRRARIAIVAPAGAVFRAMAERPR